MPEERSTSGSQDVMMSSSVELVFFKGPIQSLLVVLTVYDCKYSDGSIDDLVFRRDLVLRFSPQCFIEHDMAVGQN